METFRVRRVHGDFFEISMRDKNFKIFVNTKYNYFNLSKLYPYFDIVNAEADFKTICREIIGFLKWERHERENLYFIVDKNHESIDGIYVQGLIFLYVLGRNTTATRELCYSYLMMAYYHTKIYPQIMDKSNDYVVRIIEKDRFVFHKKHYILSGCRMKNAGGSSRRLRITYPYHSIMKEYKFDFYGIDFYNMILKYLKNSRNVSMLYRNHFRLNCDELSFKMAIDQIYLKFLDVEF